MIKTRFDSDSGHVQSLIQFKLTPPICGHFMVHRSRLDAWLSSNESARLIMVNAPAGFGKTTLLVQWFNQLKQRGDRAAWLTLDEADNDPWQFLSYLIAAIQNGNPEGDVIPLNVDSFEPGNNPSGVTLWILEKLASSSTPFSLFIDEFGVIRNPEVLSIVKQLAHHLPPGKRIVMALRNIPELGLGRIRAQGELVEINVEDLRFTINETEQFLRKSQKNDLDESDVKKLQNFTEGWIAGLQLSTLSPAWRSNSSNTMQPYNSAFGNISGYLAEDVLAHQPEEIQAFLMQTSILNRLSGPICDALTGRTDGYETLEYLERANLFLIPLDEERRWYRHHSLFARFLRNRLEKRGRDHLNILHRIASNWLEKEGEFEDAAQHALACGDIEYAADLMERCAIHLILAGNMVTVMEWGDQLPLTVLDRRPTLQLSYCYALIFRHEYENASDFIDRIETSESQSTVGLTLKDELFPLRVLVLTGQDKIIEHEQAVADNLEKYANVRLVGLAKFALNISLFKIAGILKMVSGDFDKALAYFGRAIAITPRNSNHLIGELYNKYLIASLELTQGRLQDALELVRTALSANIGPTRYSAGGMAASVLQAEILYEMNQLEKAESLISPFHNLLSTSIPPDVMIIGLRTLARIHNVRGDFSGTMHYLAELELVGAKRAIPRATASAHLEEIRIALQNNDIDQALKVSHDHDDKTVWQIFDGRCMMANDPETPEISRLRLLIAKGRAKEALEKLETDLKTARRAKRFRQQILIQILIAKAHEVCGERRPALRALNDALLAGQPGNFIRSFLDEGEPIIILLRELRKTALGGDHAPTTSISPNYFNQFFESARVVPAQQALQQTEQGSLHLEELTDREIAILEKLAMGLSNEAIADQLFISKHTVRFHLRNIHSKLGATSRIQAVALARQHGFIR